MIRGILLDIGGVLYEGDQPIPGAVQAIDELRRSYRLRFLSNTSRIPPQELLRKLESMGFSLAQEELFTALRAAANFLKSQGARAYVVATEEARAYLAEQFPPASVERFVLVCDAYTNFTYEWLNEAFRRLEAGHGFLATNVNRYFKDRDGHLSLDAGGFVRCLEYASGKIAKVVGKPNCTFFQLAIESMGFKPHQVVMVGDDIESDILGAKACWLKTVLVRTGKFKEGDLLKATPDLIIDDITQLPRRIGELEG
ncbi:MAG: TIGR01458 family HAD-type hydrolase [Nitratiruptor sp.]|nr:TIGR01458 family HAD-type hydrolase [Nitratiruptor sp.]NPA83264.1 TIGR01458 family HAD-type hydrolase [Campylobacterota bacterium]